MVRRVTAQQALLRIQDILANCLIILFIKTADSDTVSIYQVSSVQLVTDKKLEAFNKA